MTRRFQTLSALPRWRCRPAARPSLHRETRSSPCQRQKDHTPPVGTLTQHPAQAIPFRGIVPNIGSNAMNLIARPDGSTPSPPDMGFRQ